MNLHSFGNVRGSFLEVVNHGADCTFQNPELMQVPRTASKQDPMEKLIPCRILLRSFAAEKFRIERINGWNPGQVATAQLQRHVCRQERFSKPIHHCARYFNALARPDELALGPVRQCFIECDRQHCVGIFPLAHHALIEALLLLRKPGNPVVSYRASRAG